jgi:hypothetical protein
MKHATDAALGAISDLLDKIRTRSELKEKKLGVFYRKSKAFLHFHEDQSGMFADLNTGQQFERFPVNSLQERRTFFAAIDRALMS